MIRRKKKDLSKSFDRAHEDVGNIVHLEHVNVQVPDQTLATAFYVQGMGFTRDPYIMTGVENMWINMGATQFHLPTGQAQKVRGCVEIVVPDLDGLAARLAAVKGHLSGTQFGFSVENDVVSVTCPWGNHYRCHAPGAFGPMGIGVGRVQFPVEPGHADGIARFYREIMGAPAKVTGSNGGKAAVVKIGGCQELRFFETSDRIPEYEGYHIAVYITDFSGPHKKMRERDIVTEESNPHQYRFEDIVCLDTGKVLCTIEHEVRSFTHPMYPRALSLVNRNPAQRQATYAPGRDAWVPGI